MFNAWFVIINDRLYDEDNLCNTPWSQCGNLWGIKIGGRWCLDYCFKIYFNLSMEYWETKCCLLRTDEDLYRLFDDIGIAYKKGNIIHFKNKVYDENLKEIK